MNTGTLQLLAWAVAGLAATLVMDVVGGVVRKTRLARGAPHQLVGRFFSSTFRGYFTEPGSSIPADASIPLNFLLLIHYAIGIALAVVIMPATAQCQESTEDPWELVRGLEGAWEGEGAGFGQTSKLTHDWEFVLDGKFLRLRTQSVSSTADGDSEVHEDVGYVSWSEGEGVLRFRQFLSEGFVNVFTLSPAASPESGIDFDPENTEGMATFSVSMKLRFLDADTYEMVLAMGKKGTELKTCQTMKLRRMDE
jgi:hypothetical protein